MEDVVSFPINAELLQGVLRTLADATQPTEWALGGSEDAGRFLVLSGDGEGGILLTVKEAVLA